MSASSAVVPIGQTSVLVSISLTTEGEYHFYLKQIDSNDNTSGCIDSNVSYTYDKTPPVDILLFNLGAGEPSPSYGGRVNFSGVGSGSFSPGDSLEIFYQGDCDTGTSLANTTTSLDGFNLNTRLDANLPTDNMNPMFYARVKDAAGNTSACSTFPLMYALLDDPALGHTTFDVIRTDDDSTPDISVSNLDS